MAEGESLEQVIERIAEKYHYIGISVTDRRAFEAALREMAEFVRDRVAGQIRAARYPTEANPERYDPEEEAYNGGIASALGILLSAVGVDGGEDGNRS